VGDVITCYTAEIELGSSGSGDGVATRSKGDVVNGEKRNVVGGDSYGASVVESDQRSARLRRGGPSVGLPVRRIAPGRIAAAGSPGPGVQGRHPAIFERLEPDAIENVAALACLLSASGERGPTTSQSLQNAAPPCCKHKTTPRV